MIEKSLQQSIGNKDIRSINEIFAKIYSIYYKLLFFVSFQIAGDNVEAEDIVQETFLSFYESCVSFNFDSNNIKSYLTKTAKNKALNHIKNKDNKNLELDENHLESSSNDIVQSISPLFIKQWESLDEDERNIIDQHSIQGLSFKEISNLDGTSINTVKSKYRRAIIKLREGLANEKR